MVKWYDISCVNLYIKSIGGKTSDLYVPTANLAIYQNGVYYLGIKIYNHLQTAIKDLSGDKNKLKLALKDNFYLIPFTVWRNILVQN